MALENNVSSMTGFAQDRVQNELGILCGELRALNNRFLELNFRLPDTLKGIEAQIRDRLRTALTRGKIELSVRFESGGEAANLTLNQDMVRDLFAACETLSQQTRRPTTINIMDVLRFPGVIGTSLHNQQQLETMALTLVSQLLEKFQADRKREGAALVAVIATRLQKIAEHVASIKPNAAHIMHTQREKLLERVRATQIEFDHNRLEQELVFWAQKADIAEELDRLETHLAEINAALKKGGAIGRRLDFLVQELHREANTVGSKSLSSDVTYHAVEIKVLIEQIREQVQNLE